MSDMSSQRAREGICLLLNNQNEAAEELFDGTNDDIEMAAGKCFVTFINALLSYEPERLDEAVEDLRELERRCAQDVGWLKSMKNRFFGSSISFSDPDVAERLEEQIILADCQVCVALLTFLQPDLTSYLKGGWRLRRAWKVYQHTYSLILDLYKRTFPSDSNVPGSEFPSWCVMTRSVSTDLNSPTDWSVPNTPSQSGLLRSSLAYLTSFSFASSSAEPRISSEVVARLMSAISFGYGIFQLCVSLLPPSLSRIIHILGFDGDREMGLNALMFARLGSDMRGPLAMLTLLWYHTIVRPYLALDGANVQAGVDVASQLYEESQVEFADSALFLFFHGRILRLKVKIPEALKAFEDAIAKSPQREVQLLCLHEVGWCYLIQLDWGNAYQCFQHLRSKSRWSKLLYTYLAAVSVGASGDLEKANELISKLPKLLPKTQEGRTNVEILIARRCRKLVEPTTRDTCLLLGLELLYMWNALPSSSPAHVLTECTNCAGEPMIGLSALIQGVALTYQGELEMAEEHFRRCLESRKDILGTVEDPDGNDDHVSASAAFELASLLLQNAETTEEGKQLLIHTRDTYKGYDFENRIVIRIHAALRQIP